MSVSSSLEVAVGDCDEEKVYEGICPPFIDFTSQELG